MLATIITPIEVAGLLINLKKDPFRISLQKELDDPYKRENCPPFPESENRDSEPSSRNSETFPSLLTVFVDTSGEAEELAEEIKVRLQYSETELIPPSEPEDKESQPSSQKSETSPSPMTVFIDASREAEDLAEKIRNDLQSSSIHLIPPLDTSLSPSEILRTLKENVLNCDVVIVPFKKDVPLAWLNERIRYYRRTHIFRERPLYVSIFSPEEQPPPHPVSHSPRLHIQDCQDNLNQCLKIGEKQ